MINDQTFPVEEVIFADLLREAGWVSAPANPKRIDAIEKRALHETVIKESTEFVMMSFSKAIPDLFGAICGSVGMDEVDYRI